MTGCVTQGALEAAVHLHDGGETTFRNKVTVPSHDMLRCLRRLEDELDQRSAELIALRKAAVEEQAAAPGKSAPLQSALGRWGAGAQVSTVCYARCRNCRKHRSLARGCMQSLVDRNTSTGPCLTKM